VADVFLSYSREDQPIARRFAEAMSREGFDVWWDQALTIGEAFDSTTEKALEDARAVVVLWSRRSVDSRWVRAEATQAQAAHRLAPVMIEACKRPIMFELTHTADLAGWKGDVNDPAWCTFVESLRRFMNRNAPPGSPALPATPLTLGTERPRRMRRSAVWAAAAALLLSAAGVAWQFRDRPTPVAATGRDASIAVLPFVNMSGDAEQGYFSDGLSEELINRLAHIEGLRVTARTSAFAFKGRAQDVRSVGKSLGVAHILEGSVRKAGNRMRVTVQLISAADGYHLWSETYDRALSDVFAVQDEIAAAVAARLGSTLGIAPRSADFSAPASLDAYDHLLRGNAQMAKATPEGVNAAIEEYRRALAIEPGYARASAGLANAMSATGLGAAADSDFAHEREQATARALAGAPDAPLALVAKMWLHSDRREWVEADAACQAVIAAARAPYEEGICGGFLTVTGRVRTALRYREAARRADPLSMSAANVLARQYALLDMGPELRRESQRIEGLEGGRWAVDEAMFMYLRHAGAPAGEIARIFDRACPDLKEPTCSVWAAAIRSPEQGKSILRARLAALPEQAAGSANTIALAAAFLGDTGLALDALEVFSRSKNSQRFQSMWYPLLGTARKNPRFKRIVRDIGFVDLWRKTGRWTDFCRPLGSDDFECF
jgi:TolB-like protein